MCASWTERLTAKPGSLEHHPPMLSCRSTRRIRCSLGCLAMVRIDLPGIKTVRYRRAAGAGTVYYYQRASGAKLPDDPTSLEFRQALEALSEPTPRGSTAPANSLAAVIARYRASPDFKQLADNTRRDYARGPESLGPFRDHEHPAPPRPAAARRSR
jgi:hypothetical protein